MVRRRAQLALILAAACGEPSVRVHFEVPAGYQDLIDSVALEVLAPEAGGPDCDAVALGNAGAQELAAARVAEALVRDPGDEAPLGGVPRTGEKLFVARAFSPSGQLIAGGCARAGVIDGDVDVSIEGEPALTLGGRDTPSAGPLPGELTILVSDARGQPVEGVVALQTVVAADSAEPGEPATSGRGGALRFSVAQPAWAGPQVLDVDVRWQANERDLIAGFKTPFARFAEPMPSAIDPEVLDTRALYQVGRIGPAGEMGVAVLGRDGGSGQRPVHIYFYDPDRGEVTRATSEIDVSALAIGLVETADRDLVIAMNADDWYQIDPDGVVVVKNPGGLIDATALAPYGSCQPGEPRDRLLAVGAGGVPALYQSDGSRVTGWSGSQLTGVRGLLAAGCIRGLEVTYPAAVYATRPDAAEQDRPTLALDAPDAQPALVNSAIPRGIAFTPLLASGEGPFLLANRFETDGNSIARYTAVPIDGAPTFLDERDEDEIAGLSETSAGGDFDGDGLLDVAAMVAVPGGDGRGVVFRFFMALGVLVEEQRLFGLGATGIDNPDFSPLLLAADFDQDGVDDLFLATPEGFTVFELEPP